MSQFLAFWLKAIAELDISSITQSITAGEPALAKENNCLNAAKACNLNDTCKKYRSAYISPCTSRVSTAEVCNKRKCHKALRQFFDKVPPKHSYGMLFCSCPIGDQLACSERRRQTIVPACSYEDKEKPNCLALQASCKTNYICRSRLADFFTNCQPEPRSLSGCLKENYADCLLSYSGLIGTVMTPNYLRSAKISVSPFCDCSSSGNSKEECDRFTEFFTDNACLRNAIQAFGNGTDVSVWQPMPPVQTTTSMTTPSQRNRDRDRSPNAIEPATHINHLNPADNSLYQFCGSLQGKLGFKTDRVFVSLMWLEAQKLKTNNTIDVLCVDPQINDPSSSNAISRNSSTQQTPLSGLSSLLLLLATSLHCIFTVVML
ncbi:GDNF family receptor alpha-1-like protein [Labeo rohita]|uniref:GDNF family receptor alpha-1-like protein n=1 Tax=Labeo rohita TaxID=84645 RepID=A0A498NDE0_LABRO|nr:GDNF family receptor alpha-1-like protein [Labeo rohita]